MKIAAIKLYSMDSTEQDSLDFLQRRGSDCQLVLSNERPNCLVNCQYSVALVTIAAGYCRSRPAIKGLVSQLADHSQLG